MDEAQLAGLTAKQRRFVLAIEANTEGLTAVSTGICPGCDQCRTEDGVKVPCECACEKHCQSCEKDGCVGCEHNPTPGEAFWSCDKCDDTGRRAPTKEEFEEQWATQECLAEPFFSWHGCDLCGSTLGGNNEIWHACDANNEIIHGEHACMDCVCYLANGDLPGGEDD